MSLADVIILMRSLQLFPALGFRGDDGIDLQVLFGWASRSGARGLL